MRTHGDRASRMAAGLLRRPARSPLQGPRPRRPPRKAAAHASPALRRPPRARPQASTSDLVRDGQELLATSRQMAPLLERLAATATAARELRALATAARGAAAGEGGGGGGGGGGRRDAAAGVGAGGRA
jgi:hypothetical protein